MYPAKPDIPADDDAFVERIWAESPPRQRTQRRTWSKQEDVLLSQLAQCPQRRWSAIARLVPGRNAKQCRNRWRNHLDPSISKERWTAHDDHVLIEAHQRLGSQWSAIARLLPGRTDNSVKNHWHSTRRRVLKALAVSMDEARLDTQSVLFRYCWSLAASSQRAMKSMASSEGPGWDVPASHGGPGWQVPAPAANGGVGGDSVVCIGEMINQREAWPAPIQRG